VDKGYIIFDAPRTSLQDVDCVKGSKLKELTTKVQKV
jgi:hypothetical protein